MTYKGADRTGNATSSKLDLAEGLECLGSLDLSLATSPGGPEWFNKFVGVDIPLHGGNDRDWSWPGQDR
jgi:hypothetical protein